MGEVRVPDIPGPTAPLCWALGPTMVRCDRRAGHEGAHTWEPVPVAPAADDLDAALAWADKTIDERLSSCRRIGNDHDFEDEQERTIETLAAAVRSLQDEVEVASSLYHTTKEQLARSDAERDAIRADLAALVDAAPALLTEVEQSRELRDHLREAVEREARLTADLRSTRQQWENSNHHHATEVVRLEAEHAEVVRARGGEGAAMSDDPRGASRGQAFDCYDPPFRYQLGYIFDAHGRMVADVPEKDQSVLAICRVRGWGRLQYRTDCDPEALQDMVGILIAEALTWYWESHP